MAASSADDDFVADINVTPFVDVMLVLLIIFMVTAPLMTQGLDVDLPTTQATDSLPTDSETVTMTIKADQTIWLDKYQITDLETLPDLLEENVKKQNKLLFLQADKDVNYGLVVDIMGRLRLAGIEKIGMIADKVEAAPAASAAPAKKKTSGK